MGKSAPCPICGLRRGLTTEDVVPIWLRKTMLGLTGPWPKNQLPPKFKLRICEPCNSSLGTRFEAIAAPLVKPLVEGRDVRLSFRDQKIISTWIVKGALLGIVARNRSDARLSEVVVPLLRYIIETRLPPHGCSVRLCSVNTSHDKEPVEEVIDPYLPHIRPLIAYYAVANFGALGFELLVGDQETLLPFMADVDADSRFVRIWPPVSREAEWPPPSPLAWHEIPELRNAWANDRDPDMPVPFDYSWTYSGEYEG